MEEFCLAPPRPQGLIGREPFHRWTLPDGSLWTEFHRLDGAYLLRFPGLADFLVTTDAPAVTCLPVPGVSEATVHHLYLNQVLPLVLSKLGRLVFHASAVEVGDGAVAFVAESGRGKSTLAASFAVSGNRFLTDDGLVVEAGTHGFEVLPSHPSIRLWGDSEAALIPPGALHAPAVGYSPKARVLAGEGLSFCEKSRPLRRVYFLGDGSATGIEVRPLSPADALIEWVKNSFLLDIEERPRLASHFEQVAALANRPIHYHLDYPRRFEDLVRVREAIVEHACAEGAQV